MESLESGFSFGLNNLAGNGIILKSRKTSTNMRMFYCFTMYKYNIVLQLCSHFVDSRKQIIFSELKKIWDFRGMSREKNSVSKYTYFCPPLQKRRL